MVVMADSSGKRLEDRLGHVLVKQGKLSAQRLEEALQTQKATLQRLGHILVTSNAITAKDLREALQIQVSQIVFKVFRWRDGEYLFDPTDSVDYDRENFSPMSADFILMEGIRMVDEWPIIEKKIPSMDIVFRPVVDPALIEVGGDDEGPEVELLRPGRPEASQLRLEQDPPDPERGGHLPQGGRHAHGPEHHRLDRTGGVRDLPDAVRPVEPQPHLDRGPRRRADERDGHPGGAGRDARSAYGAMAVVLLLAARGHRRPLAHAVRGDRPAAAPAAAPSGCSSTASATRGCSGSTAPCRRTC